jgi:hypothetical protein
MPHLSEKLVSKLHLHYFFIVFILAFIYNNYIILIILADKKEEKDTKSAAKKPRRSSPERSDSRKVVVKTANEPKKAKGEEKIFVRNFAPQEEKLFEQAISVGNQL